MRYTMTSEDGCTVIEYDLNLLGDEAQFISENVYEEYSKYANTMLKLEYMSDTTDTYTHIYNIFLYKKGYRDIQIVLADKEGNIIAESTLRKVYSKYTVIEILKSYIYYCKNFPYGK